MTALEQTIRDLVRDEVARQLAERERPAELVTVEAYARTRSISPSTVRAAIRTGRLPATRIGRSVRVATDATIAPRRGRETASDRARRILRGAR